MFSDSEDDELKLDPYNTNDEIDGEEIGEYGPWNSLQRKNDDESTENIDSKQILTEIMNTVENIQVIEYERNFQLLNRYLRSNYLEIPDNFDLTLFSRHLIDLLEKCKQYRSLLHQILEFYRNITDIDDKDTNEYKISSLLASHKDQNGNYIFVFRLLDIINAEVDLRIKNPQTIRDFDLFRQIFDILENVFDNPSSRNFPVNKYINIIQDIIIAKDFVSFDERYLAIGSIVKTASCVKLDSYSNLYLDFIKLNFDLIHPILVLELLGNLNWNQNVATKVLNYQIHQENSTFSLIMELINNQDPEISTRALHTLCILSFQVPSFAEDFRVDPLIIVAERLGIPQFSETCLEIISIGLRYSYVMPNIIANQLIVGIVNNFNLFGLKNKNRVIDIIKFIMDNKIEAFSNDMKLDFIIPILIDFVELVSEEMLFSKIRSIFMSLFSQDIERETGCINKFVELDGTSAFIDLAERRPEIAPRVSEFLNRLHERYGIEI